MNLEEKKAQEATEYQWQKDHMKHIAEQAKSEGADQEARHKAKQLAYRRDLIGQMNYEQRKKQEVQSDIYQTEENFNFLRRNTKFNVKLQKACRQKLNIRNV